LPSIALLADPPKQVVDCEAVAKLPSARFERSAGLYIVGVAVKGDLVGSSVGAGVAGSIHCPFWHVPHSLELHAVPFAKKVDSVGHEPSWLHLPTS